MKRPFFLMADAGGGAGGSGDAGAGAGAAGGATLLSGAGAAAGAAGAGAGAGATTTPAFSWAKEDGTFSEGWQDRLPDDVKSHASLKVIGSVGDLAKSYVATKEMVGKRLEAPGEGATPEQISAWRKVVGAPETPQGYLADGQTSLRPEAVPEGLWDKGNEDKFVAIAHKHNLPPAAVKEILGFYGESIKGGLEASQAEQQAMLTEQGNILKKTWGGEYDANIRLAERVADTVGLPRDHAAFTDATVIQAFAKMGKLFSEDKLVKGDTTGVNGSIRDKIRDFTDPASTSVLSREYRGEFGPERQNAAQGQYHELLKAAEQIK